MKKFYYDFHIHSCLSPCGDDDMTPNNIVNMAKLKNLDVIAVSDHNSMKNVKVIMEVAKKESLLVLPAMELQTSEDIHVLCLFADVEKGLKFSEYIYGTLQKIKNNTEIYGHQLILDKNDNIVSTEDNLLIVSSSIGVYDIPMLIKKYSGVAILAHIDKDANSAISTLGSINLDMNYSCVEISKNATSRFFNENSYIEKDYKILHNSDAHYLWDISERKNYIDLLQLTGENIIKNLSSKK